MEFYTSDEALDAFTEAQKPDGPYCIKGYELPEDSYDAVKQAQEYFDAGKVNVALEFQTAVKGTNCEYICSELATGQTTAEEAAQAYDDDCKNRLRSLDWTGNKMMKQPSAVNTDGCFPSGEESEA